MNRIVFMLAVLLVGGLFAGSAFAQYGDGMSLSAGRVDEMSLMPGVECLSEIDFDDVGLSPDVVYSMMTATFYGFDMAGGGGLSDGKGAKFCSYNWGYENCGSCLDYQPWGRGKIRYQEGWCLGVRVWRHESCQQC